MEYFIEMDMLDFYRAYRTYRTYALYGFRKCKPPLVNSLSNDQAVDLPGAGVSRYGIH